MHAFNAKFLFSCHRLRIANSFILRPSLLIETQFYDLIGFNQTILYMHWVSACGASALYQYTRSNSNEFIFALSGNRRFAILPTCNKYYWNTCSFFLYHFCLQETLIQANHFVHFIPNPNNDINTNIAALCGHLNIHTAHILSKQIIIKWPFKIVADGQSGEIQA